MSTRGFTLIELLVVIAIVAVLASLLLPTVWLVKDQSRSLQCRSNLRQVMLGIESYQSDTGFFPPAALTTAESNWLVDRATARWQNLLEPYLETYQVFNCPAALHAEPGNNYSLRVRNAAEGWIQRGDAAAGTVCLMALNLNDWGRYPSNPGDAWTPSNPGPMTSARVATRIAAAGTGSIARCPVIFDGVWINSGNNVQINRYSAYFPHRLKANMAFIDSHTESHVVADYESFGDWTSQPMLIRE